MSIFTSLLGGIFGGVGAYRSGRDQNKEARSARQSVDDKVVQAQEINRADQARAIAYRDADQARINAQERGYDFGKLRDDALKAGFNPLTALQATGGQGYGLANEVLTTPFLAESGLAMDRANLFGSLSQDVVRSAGYVGDAIGAFGNGFMSQLNLDRDFSLQGRSLDLEGKRLVMDQAMQNAMVRQGGGSSGPFGGGGVMPVTPVSSPTFWDGVKNWADPVQDLLVGNRPEQVQPIQNMSPFWKMVAPWTGGTVLMPGSDGDNMGLDELMVWAGMVGPQVAKNWAVKGGQYLWSNMPSYEFSANGPTRGNPTGQPTGGYRGRGGWVDTWW